MKSKNIYNLLEVSDTLKDRTLKELNVTKSEVDEAVQTVIEWLQVQPHLQNVIPDPRQIECLFVGSKGSIERTKQGMDQYFALKTNIPEIFMNRDPAATDFRVAFEGFSCALQYPVTSSGHRVLCMKCHEDTSRMNIYDSYKVLMMLFELKARYDYASGCIIVCDYTNFVMGHILKVPPVAVKKVLLAIQGPFLTRIKGLHIINAPSYSEPLITLVRSLLKQKLRDRIFLHKNMESLHKVVDKSLLPEDFGGTQKPMREIEDLWFKELLNWRDWFLEEEKNISDESKRPMKDSNPDEFLGINGSFRKLNVD